MKSKIHEHTIKKTILGVRKTLKFLSIALILIVGMLFTFQRCQKEESIKIEENQNGKYRSEILTYEDLLSKKELSTSLSLLSKVLDVNVKDKADADSFVIKTSEVISVSTDSTQTYTFKIAKPTLTTSIFEYFVIDMSDVNTPKYFITRFTPKADATDGEFPFDVTFQNLSEYQIEMDDYQIHLTKWEMCVSSYTKISPRDDPSYDVDIVEWWDCSGSGQGIEMGGDTTTNDTTNDTSNDSGDTSTSETVTGGGGGTTTTTTTTTSGDYPAPVGIRTVDYPDVLADVLNYLYNGVAPAYMIDWVYNEDNFMQVNNIMKFLINNNYSAEAMTFVWQAVKEMINNNISLTDYLNNLVLFDSNKPSNIVLNLKTDIIDCFDIENNTSGYHTITLYVDQPIANSSETYTFEGVDVEVGHTFVSLEQNLDGQINTKTFGFYPLESVSPNNPINSPKYCDDGGHEYDVSIKIEISPSVFNNIIYYLSFLNDNSINYNLNSYNCSDFGLGIFNMSGANIPDTYSTWSIMGNTLGGGTNPAALGQDIRNLNTSPSGTLTVNLNGGNASASKPCQ